MYINEKEWGSTQPYNQQRLSLCHPEGWWSQEGLLQRTGGRFGGKSYKLGHKTVVIKEIWMFMRQYNLFNFRKRTVMADEGSQVGMTSGVWDGPGREQKQGHAYLNNVQ